jgi:hypothetical protein
LERSRFLDAQGPGGAEKVARYRHAQLSAMRLSGDLNARPENVNVEELLESIRAEWAVLGPLIEVLSFSGDSEVGPSLHESPPPIEQVATGVVARAQTRGLLRIIRYRSGLIETSASASSGHRMIGKTMALAGQLLVCPTAWKRVELGIAAGNRPELKGRTAVQRGRACAARTQLYR